MSDASLGSCQEILGYTFQNLALLEQALTHASIAPTRLNSNERLEFLGDAVLGLSVCSALFEQFEDLLEGEMTKIKSTVVSRKTCAEVVRNLGLVEHLRLGGDLGDPGRVPESVAAGVYESLVGAVYVDGGYKPANAFVMKHMQPFIDAAMENTHQENFKSLLQQHAQRKASATPEYTLLDEQGPDHSKCFEVAVSIGGRHYPSAWGRSKKEAEQAAARRALVTLGLLEDESDDTLEAAAED
ncbi:MAG: ribonuclease III [Phycisphaerae bacterium]|nr:ribonuclease III [Phycisphaerae bacterium]